MDGEATITLQTLSVAPTAIIASAQEACANENVKLTIQGGILGKGAVWKWYSNSCGNVPVGTGSSISVKIGSTTTFYARAEGFCNTTSCAATTVNFVPNCLDRTSYNYIRTRASQKEGYQIIPANPVVEDISTEYLYFDELGRTEQQLLQQQSPSKIDVLSFSIYDAYGRKTHQYLPAVIGSNSGMKVQHAREKILSFYRSSDPAHPLNVAVSNVPFAETYYEPSPLSRILEQGSPGEDWQVNKLSGVPISTNKTIKFIYRTNIADDKIRLWKYVSAADGFGSVSTNGFYGNHQLSVTETIDEAKNKTIEYKNKEGQVIVKKVQLISNAQLANESHWLITCYIYDGFGNLRLVLPPQAYTEIVFPPSGTYTINKTSAILEDFCFAYHYDARRRMAEKKVPGADWVYMVYDNRDRLVLTQDGNQRNKTNREWSFTKYDQLNRPILAGIHDTTSLLTQVQMQGVVNTHINKNTDRRYSEVLVGTASGNIHNYSNRGYPKVKSANSCLSVTYYDNYGFLSYTGWDAENRSYGFISEISVTQNFGLVTGLATGGKVKVLDGSNHWLNSVSYYDDKYRLIQSIHENNAGGTDRITTLYNFPGWVKQTRHTHTGPKAITVHRKYEHDHAGRVTSVTHNIDEKGDVLLASFKYNELGELVDKKLHVSGSTGLQSIDYRYNIRGWLTHINNSKLTSDNGLTNDDANDYFGMELIYNGTMGDFPMAAYSPFQKPFHFDFHNPSSVMLASNENRHPSNAWASVNHPSKSTAEDLIREANDRIEAYLKENKNITSEFKVAEDERIIEEKGTGAINSDHVDLFEAESYVASVNSTPCGNLSPLPCTETVVNLPYSLNFTGTEGGLNDMTNTAGTGFTMTIPPSAPLAPPTNPDVPGYEPSLLEIASGRLRITTTAGIMSVNPATSTNTNSQVNALGVGLRAHNKPITIETTVVNPPAATNQFEQAGLYFGLDEDNYVKLVVIASNSGRGRIQLNREINAVSVSSNDEINSVTMVLSSSTVRLRMVIDPAANTAEAFYRINTGAEISLGSLAIPASFAQGITLGSQPNVSFAGIFATHRRATNSLVYEFDDFHITTPLTVPAAPSNLAATAVSSTEISLSWDNHADNAENVVVESTTDLNEEFTVLATLEPNENSYSHVGLSGGQTYYYRVSASNGAGSSAVSDTASATTPLQPGGICSDISPLPCTETVVSLPYSLNFTGAEGGLKDMTNSAGTGFTMAIPPSAPLAPPTNPDVPGYEPSLLEIASGRLRITTTAGIMSVNPATSTNTNSQVNALGVGVQAHNRPITLETTVVNPPAATNQFEQAGLYFGLDEDNYIKLVVLAASSGGARIQFNREINAVSTGNEEVNSAIMTLSSSTVRLKLVIDPATNTAEAFYRINTGAEVNLGSYTIPASFTQGITLGSQSNVSFAGIFATHRRATNSLVYEFEDFNITAPLTIPAAPSDLVATAAGATEISLSWDNNAVDADNNIVERATAVDGPYAAIATLPANANTYNDMGLTTGQTYYYQVKAKNTAGEAISNRVSIIISSGGTAPAAPTNLVVSTGGTNSLKLEWEDNATNETGYVVERLNGTNWQVVANLPSNATSYTLTGLSAGATLQVRVKAVNGATGSAYAQASGTTSGHVPGAFAFEPQFNGNIAGVKWANNGGSSQNKEKAYVYRYDPANRLTKSSYAVRNPVGGQLDRGGFNENLTYDHNGNILTLQRSGLAPVATLIDDLSYNKYIGNQLYQVTDHSTNHAGFKDGNISGDDYDYDKNGNMTVDKNKGITNIKYNHLNLPEEITLEGGRKIEYIYNAAGTKLGQRVTEPGKPVKETWYVGEIIYENELNQTKELVLIHHEEGRIVPDAITAGAYEYQYHIKDHLGNVRVTFTSKPKTHTYTVNYENSQAKPDDIALFAETGNIIINNLFDKTDAGTTYTKSQMLTGANGAKIGSVIAIPVGAGDKISAEVYAKYVAATNGDNPGGSIAPLLLAALTGTPGATIVDGSSSAITTGYGNSSLITNAAYNYSYDATAPMAFINLLFIPERAQSSIDKAHFAFKQINKGAQQIGTTTSAAHDLMQINNFEAKENGYVIIYLSNESAKLTEVYFDELKITLNENAVIQTDDYYPFGLTFNGFKRVTDRENRFLYQEKEFESRFDLNTYDFHFRMYDPALARTFQMDPHAENYYRWSPNSWAFNNPVIAIDPDGRDARIITSTDSTGNTTSTIQSTIYITGTGASVKKAEKLNRYTLSSPDIS